MRELMQKPWFEKHRPLKIEDVVFESPVVEAKIKEFVEQGYIRGNIISYGPGGVGKTTLNKILLHSIVKSRDDFFILGKGVESIEQLKSWLINVSMTSKQRIVICEEFDQLSSAAQTALKNGLMENYMPGVAFIVTTNKIHSIDGALLQRFNEKINFESFDVDGCYFRMIKILEEEEIEFDNNELYKLVGDFKNKGIRELINNMQGACLDKKFSLANLGNNIISTSGVEDAIMSYVKYFIQTIMGLPIDEIYLICNTPTEHPTIAEFYIPMLKWMETDPSINYEYIYTTLLNDVEIILPLKEIITRYYQEAKLKPLQNIHFQSCLFEIFITLYTIKGGEKRLIH